MYNITWSDIGNWHIKQMFELLNVSVLQNIHFIQVSNSQEKKYMEYAKDAKCHLHEKYKYNFKFTKYLVSNYKFLTN